MLLYYLKKFLGKMLKKISILLIDLLLHTGLFSPLWMLPGYLPLLILLFYPFAIAVERKFLGCSLAEGMTNKKFVIYPSFKTILHKPIFLRPKYGVKRSLLFKFIVPLASLLTFFLTEPLDTFATSFSQNAQVVLVEELGCSIMKPVEGELSEGVLKLPRNGGNLPYQVYKMDMKEEQMAYSVQRSHMQNEWTRYPYSLVMKGAVYVVLNDAALDRVHSKENGTHQGNRSTIIRGEKNGQAQLIRIVLFNQQIYKIQVSYPLNAPEKEAQAIEFVNSFTPS